MNARYSEQNQQGEGGLYTVLHFILFHWDSEIQSVNEDIQPLKKKHINNGKSIQSPKSDAHKLRNQHFSPEVCEGLTEKKFA